MRPRTALVITVLLFAAAGVSIGASQAACTPAPACVGGPGEVITIGPIRTGDLPGAAGPAVEKLQAAVASASEKAGGPLDEIVVGGLPGPEPCRAACGDIGYGASQCVPPTDPTHQPPASACAGGGVRAGWGNDDILGGSWLFGVAVGGGTDKFGANGSVMGSSACLICAQDYTISASGGTVAGGCYKVTHDPVTGALKVSSC